MMTKKHFKKLAEMCGGITDPTLRREQAEELARLCKADNPRFDRERFMQAVENAAGEAPASA